MRSNNADTWIGLRALLLGFLAVMIAGALLLLVQEEAVNASGHQEMESVVVSPGDTLWEIADRFSPESVDLRVVIRETSGTERVGIQGPEARSGPSGSCREVLKIRGQRPDLTICYFRDFGDSPVEILADSQE